MASRRRPRLIAVQNVVERKVIREEGKSRWDLGREAFVERCREFALKTREQILGQPSGSGLPRQASAPLPQWTTITWTRFSPRLSVLTSGFDLQRQPYNQLVSARSLSHLGPRGQLRGCGGQPLRLRYPFIDARAPVQTGKNTPQVFSTRPEMMLGDVALVVNPETKGTRTWSAAGSRCLVEREMRSSPTSTWIRVRHRYPQGNPGA